MSKSKIHKVDVSVEAIERGWQWHFTMLCGLELPLVPDAHDRPWTHTDDSRVTCEGCIWRGL